ncbi:hypothetical protein PRIPAC_81755 [Pristionchus pacificus]|nr:hypothetical protein PRIPAC_81755 [Pristionchus pacificus]
MERRGQSGQKEQQRIYTLTLRRFHYTSTLEPVMKSKLLTEVPFEQLEMSGSNLTDGVFALLVKAIEAHGVNRLSLNVGNVKNRDPITALFRLSTLVRSLHITQHHYNTYGAHEFFGRYSLDWALVFLKMFSNKLDKLRVENRSFKDYLSIEQANRLPLLEKHVWFEATCNKYDNGLSVERDGYWIEADRSPIGIHLST